MDRKIETGAFAIPLILKGYNGYSRCNCFLFNLEGLQRLKPMQSPFISFRMARRVKTNAIVVHFIQNCQKGQNPCSFHPFNFERLEGSEGLKLVQSQSIQFTNVIWVRRVGNCAIALHLIQKVSTAYNKCDCCSFALE